MSKGQVLQDPFLNILRKEKVPVSIYLVNGSSFRAPSILLISSSWFSRTA